MDNNDVVELLESLPVINRIIRFIKSGNFPNPKEASDIGEFLEFLREMDYMDKVLFAAITQSKEKHMELLESISKKSPSNPETHKMQKECDSAYYEAVIINAILSEKMDQLIPEKYSKNKNILAAFHPDFSITLNARSPMALTSLTDFLSETYEDEDCPDCKDQQRH